MRATLQDGSYPRPTLCRDHWASLDGTWRFAHDDADAGRSARWHDPVTVQPFTQRIEVPFPPESPASGVGARGFHPVVWYRRTVRGDQIAQLGEDVGRLLVHFGAVDHSADVWFDGQLVAHHVGGQTPFTADVTDALDGATEEHVLVVRAEDRPENLEQPRGKQDWREKPHGIWYERTTGIWQPVWLERVPTEHVVDVQWTPHLTAGTVEGRITLGRFPRQELLVEATLRLGEEVLAVASYLADQRTVSLTVSVAAMRNGQDRGRLSWSPESPVLLDASVVLLERESGREVDAVATYLGLRSVSVAGGSFNLNGQPYYTRAVLNQGYRQHTHLASVGTDELRAEVELIKAMGFNAVRIHQKAEDPRFLFWADRLGLLVWGESASGYEFTPRAVALLTTEWMDIVRRYRAHPSLVVWVPVNESWGVQDIAAVVAQQQFAQSLVSLTRALDPSRPAVSNEGWEHVDSDILGLHDYEVDPDVLRARYVDKRSAHETVLAAHGPAGRRPILNAAQVRRFLDGGSPLMITEFGGISMSDDEQSWGYEQVGSVSEYAALVGELFVALRASQDVVGFCYTQFMDTGQETNGLVRADGTPKLPVEVIAQLVTGNKDPDTESSSSEWSHP